MKQSSLPKEGVNLLPKEFYRIDPFNAFPVRIAPHYELNRLEMLSRIKRSSLSPQIINNTEKSFVRFDASVLIYGSPVCSSNKDNTEREREND
jgi:hypothetical protein